MDLFGSYVMTYFCLLPCFLLFLLRKMVMRQIIVCVLFNLQIVFNFIQFLLEDDAGSLVSYSNWIVFLHTFSNILPSTLYDMCTAILFSMLPSAASQLLLSNTVCQKFFTYTHYYSLLSLLRKSTMGTGTSAECSMSYGR